MMRNFLNLSICLTIALLVGCGKSGPPATAKTKTGGTAKAGTTSTKATDKADEGQPPKRAKIPSDDLFATLVQAFVGNDEGNLYGKTDKQLDDLGVEGIPTFVDALQGGGIAARKLACIKLANLGPEAAPAVDALTDALNDEDASVRANAASVLSIFPQPPENLVSKLTDTLKDESADTWHSMSIVALSNLGTLAADSVPSLVPFLKSDDPELRRDTLRTLKSIGPAAKDVLPDIQKLTEDENERVSDAAKEAVAFLESIDRPTEKIGQASDSPGENSGLPPLIPQLAPPEPDEDAVEEESPEPAAPAVPKQPDAPVDEPIEEE